MPIKTTEELANNGGRCERVSLRFQGAHRSLFALKELAPTTEPSAAATATEFVTCFKDRAGPVGAYNPANRSRTTLFSLAGLLCISSVCSAQVGIGLAPMRLEMNPAPRAVQSGLLTITNETDKAVRVRASLLDFFIDETDTPQFAVSLPAEASTSCRSWLGLNPMEFEVAPKRSSLVRYTLRVPATVAQGSYHCAAGFTTLPTAQDMEGTGLRSAVRMIAAFYPVVGNPEIKGQVVSVGVERANSPPKSPWRAVVVLRNSGSRYYRPKGTLDLVDDAGKVIKTLEFPSLPVLPNRDQRFLFPLEIDRDQTQFTLRARVSLGPPEILEAFARVEIAPEPVAEPAPAPDPEPVPAPPPEPDPEHAPAAEQK